MMRPRHFALLGAYVGTCLAILSLVAIPYFMPISHPVLEWSYEQIGVEMLTTSGPLVAALVAVLLWKRLSD